MAQNSSPIQPRCLYNVPMALDDDGIRTRGLKPGRGYSRNRRYVQDAKECTVGPMPVQMFLDAFLPAIPAGKEKQVLSSKQAFKDIPRTGAKPPDIYSPLLTALNTSTTRRSRAPGFVFENASRNTTEPHTPGFMKPHICCYKRENLVNVHDAPPSSRVELGYAELFFEVKPDVALDFFVDPPPDATSEERDAHDFFAQFRSDELRRRAERAFGQHIAYAQEIQARQHRTCLFSVSMSGSRARLFRWDRSGVIVSEAFDIVARPDLVCEFLARFSLADDEARGHDTSVEVATPEEELVFRDVVSEYVKDQLDLSGDALAKAVAEHYLQGGVYAVPVLAGGSAGTSSSPVTGTGRYLVSRPVTSPLHLLGRATRGHWAVQSSSKRLVFLKDTWRTSGEREGTILAELNTAGVRNVPQFVAQCDVLQQLSTPGQEKRASLVQSTETDRYRTQPWVCGVRGEPISVSAHRHYRLVVGTVGYPMRRLKGTDELLRPTYDVFRAMRDALSKTSRLHRDISIGNIILVKEPGSDTRTGYLIDWETSSRCDSEGCSLDSSRTGTWTFMSTKVLSKPTEPHMLEDDMESLFYVVLYCAFLYMPHNLDSESIGAIMEKLFDEAMMLGEIMRGGFSKSANRATRAYTDICKFKNPDLQKWLDDVMDLHGPKGLRGKELSRLWRNPENLDKLWREFLAERTLARDDRVEHELPDPPTLRHKPENSLVTFIPPAPPAATPRSAEGGLLGGRGGTAHNSKRQRPDSPGPGSSRRSERLRARLGPLVSPLSTR